MDFVHKYYQIDPDTEMVMFGRELVNGMEVLIESASCRADLATHPYSGTVEEEIFNWRMNRWFKVARLLIADDYINFVAIHSDDTEATHRWSADSGWIVKKSSVPEGWPFENGNQKVPEIVKWNAEGIAKKYCERMKLKMVPLDQEGESSSAFEWAKQNGYDIVKLDGGYVSIKSIQDAMIDSMQKAAAKIGEELKEKRDADDFSSATWLKCSGYSNVAISQIMGTTEARVKDLLERDPNYRPVDPEFEAQQERLRLEKSRRVLAHRLTSDGKTVEEISRVLGVQVGIVKLLLTSDPEEDERDFMATKPSLMTKEAQARIADELASGRIKAEVVQDWSDLHDPNVVVRLTSSKPNRQESIEDYVFPQFMRENAKFFDSRKTMTLHRLNTMYNEFCMGPAASPKWRQSLEALEVLAKPYWRVTHDPSREGSEDSAWFEEYLGYGLTAGQMMAQTERDFMEPCACSEHGPCPLHKTN